MSETTYRVGVTGITEQGDAVFTVALDPYGRQPYSTVDFGSVKLNTPYPRAFYLINRGRAMTVTVTKGNPNWATSNIEEDIKLEDNFGSTPLGLNRIRKVDVAFTLLKPLVPPAGGQFRFDLDFKGTVI
jgi:hypothetical protein